jgi:glutathione S-transferase
MSTCTRKVLTTLAETNTPYEMTVVDFAKGEHKQQPHLSRQPFGQVPTIQDEGFELYESRAISRYINEKVNGNLVPKDAAGRARMEQWISIETSNFSGAAMKFVYEHVFKRPQTQETLQAAEKQVDLALDVMERQLASQQFVAGSQLSIADICFMPYFEYLQASPIKENIAKRGKVADWWNRVSGRPSWKKVTGRA